MSFSIYKSFIMNKTSKKSIPTRSKKKSINPRIYQIHNRKDTHNTQMNFPITGIEKGDIGGGGRPLIVKCTQLTTKGKRYIDLNINKTSKKSIPTRSKKKFINPGIYQIHNRKNAHNTRQRKNGPFTCIGGGDRPLIVNALEKRTRLTKKIKRNIGPNKNL